MSRRKSRQQVGFPDFDLPFSGQLDPENRRVKLAQHVPWGLAERRFHAGLCEEFGAPIVPARTAWGALLARERCGLTDRDPVEAICENPHGSCSSAWRKFREKKRRFGLVRVIAKLSGGSEAQIALTFLAMNLERALRLLFFALVWLLSRTARIVPAPVHARPDRPGRKRPGAAVWRLNPDSARSAENRKRLPVGLSKDSIRDVLPAGTSGKGVAHDRGDVVMQTSDATVAEGEEDRGGVVAAKAVFIAIEDEGIFDSQPFCRRLVAIEGVRTIGTTEAELSKHKRARGAVFDHCVPYSSLPTRDSLRILGELIINSMDDRPVLAQYAQTGVTFPFDAGAAAPAVIAHRSCILESVGKKMDFIGFERHNGRIAFPRWANILRYDEGSQVEGHLVHRLSGRSVPQ